MATNATIIYASVEQINDQLSNDLHVLNGILFIYIVLGVIGNSIVTFIYGFRMKVRMDDKFFILVMAAIDTVVCLTGPVFSLVRNIFPVNFQNDGICRAAWFFVRIMNGFSGLLMLVIGAQRYLKVCRPMGKQMTTKLKKIILLTTFLLTVALHVPIIFVFGVSKIPFEHANVTGFRCGVLIDSNGLNGQIYLMFMFASAVVVMVMICVVYGVIGRKIYRHLRRMESLPSGKKTMYDGNNSTSSRTAPEVFANTSQAEGEYQVSTGSESRREGSQTPADNLRKKLPTLLKRKRINSMASVFSVKRNPFQYHRYTIMFLVISFITVVTYTPGLLDNLIVNVDSIYFWNELHSGERTLHLFLFQFYMFNHVVNPVIYACFDSKFRKKLLSVFCCKKNEE